MGEYGRITPCEPARRSKKATAGSRARRCADIRTTLEEECYGLSKSSAESALVTEKSRLPSRRCGGTVCGGRMGDAAAHDSLFALLKYTMYASVGDNRSEATGLDICSKNIQKNSLL